ncbi:hypothetical protein [Dokdonia sp.]|uniref:DUF7738 domain-containing protein n=1 Tax=Dokdonia sp. TaxID=2024995 RepID=UPI003266A7A8
MGIFDFRDPNKRRKKIATITVHCNLNEVSINTTTINFPTNYTTLKEILGDATRIEAIKHTNNSVYLWDELGIYCSTTSPEKMLMLLLVVDNRYGLGYQPKNNFKGTVLIDGKPLESTIQDVGADRPYMIRSISKENKQVAIALGWNPVI